MTSYKLQPALRSEEVFVDPFATEQNQMQELSGIKKLESLNMLPRLIQGTPLMVLQSGMGMYRMCLRGGWTVHVNHFSRVMRDAILGLFESARQNGSYKGFFDNIDKIDDPILQHLLSDTDDETTKEKLAGIVDGIGDPDDAKAQRERNKRAREDTIDCFGNYVRYTATIRYISKMYHEGGLIKMNGTPTGGMATTATGRTTDFYQWIEWKLEGGQHRIIKKVTWTQFLWEEVKKLATPGFLPFLSIEEFEKVASFQGFVTTSLPSRVGISDSNAPDDGRRYHYERDNRGLGTPQTPQTQTGDRAYKWLCYTQDGYVQVLPAPDLGKPSWEYYYKGLMTRPGMSEETVNNIRTDANPRNRYFAAIAKCFGYDLRIFGKITIPEYVTEIVDIVEYGLDEYPSIKPLIEKQGLLYQAINRLGTGEIVLSREYTKKELRNYLKTILNEMIDSVKSIVLASERKNIGIGIIHELQQYAQSKKFYRDRMVAYTLAEVDRIITNPAGIGRDLTIALPDTLKLQGKKKKKKTGEEEEEEKMEDDKDPAWEKAKEDLGLPDDGEKLELKAKFQHEDVKYKDDGSDRDEPEQLQYETMNLKLFDEYGVQFRPFGVLTGHELYYVVTGETRKLNARRMLENHLVIPQGLESAKPNTILELLDPVKAVANQERERKLNLMFK